MKDENSKLNALIDKKLTEEEIQSLTNEELKKVIAEKKKLSLKYFNRQSSQKVIINSIYGAFANEYFHFYNIDLAECITLQGQDIIKFCEKIINKYFSEFWHKDTKLHNILGLDEPPKQIKQESSVYIDTDSVFFSAEPALQSCNWKGDSFDFMMKIYDNRLHKYFEDAFEKYAKSYNTDNCQQFELESIANKGIWVSKKKYVQDIIWKDGKEYGYGENISTKGLEIVQSSTPSFCREKLDNLVRMLFEDHEDVDGIVNYLSKIKEEMKFKNVEQISKNTSVNNYEKYVIEDNENLQIASGCGIHLRGAAFYNHLLNNSKYKNKYELIKSGDKIRWYYSLDPNCDAFSYQPGGYPIELAPRVDYDKQFEITILDPFNRIAVPTGFPKLNRDLVYTTSLF